MRATKQCDWKSLGSHTRGILSSNSSRDHELRWQSEHPPMWKSKTATKNWHPFPRRTKWASNQEFAWSGPLNWYGWKQYSLWSVMMSVVSPCFWPPHGIDYLENFNDTIQREEIASHIEHPSFQCLRGWNSILRNTTPISNKSTHLLSSSPLTCSTVSSW